MKGLKGTVGGCCCERVPDVDEIFEPKPAEDDLLNIVTQSNSEVR